MRPVMPAQIESSSEDAADADDNDDDFEPEGGHKRARKQPARSKVGSAAEVFDVRVPFKKCIINPHNPLPEIKRFLEGNGLQWEIYTMQCAQLNSGDGTMLMNGTSIKFDLKKKSKVESHFFWDSITRIKSIFVADSEMRNVVFQTSQGLVYSVEVDGMIGDYSRFRK